MNLMVNKIKKYTPLLIVWNDATSDTGWFDEEDYKHFLENDVNEAINMKDIGFFLEVYKDFLIMCTSLDSVGKKKHTINAIPLKIINKIIVLKTS